MRNNTSDTFYIFITKKRWLFCSCAVVTDCPATLKLHFSFSFFVFIPKMCVREFAYSVSRYSKPFATKQKKKRQTHNKCANDEQVTQLKRKFMLRIKWFCSRCAVATIVVVVVVPRMNNRFEKNKRFCCRSMAFADNIDGSNWLVTNSIRRNMPWIGFVDPNRRPFVIIGIHELGRNRWFIVDRLCSLVWQWWRWWW